MRVSKYIMESCRGVFVVFVIYLIALTNCDETSDHGLLVQTKLGKVRGSLMSTDRNNEIYAFRGIPYAKPPLKDLRFKAPVPSEAWNGTLDATHSAHDCIQFEFFNKTFLGDEDCLYLNVYSPAIISYDNTMPVMVFIHGGGFSSGSGSTAMFGPQRLLDRDIVLVTINYRIGVFGFMSTEDISSPGNYGLLDQVESLRWVRENINSFGGDPNRVTIFGESAGGASVLYHVASPLSKGLFHGAIAQSGAPISFWAFDFRPKRSAIEIGNRLECPTNCSTKLVECLRKQSAVDLLIASHIKGIAYAPVMTTPVADVQYGGSFVPDNPYVLFKSNKINKVPIMGGIMADEGILFHLIMSAPVGSLKGINQTFLANVLPLYNSILKPGSSALEKLKKYLKTNYFENVTTWQENVAAFSKFYGDSMVSSQMDTVLAFLSQHDVPTYIYKLTYRGQHSIADFYRSSDKDVDAEVQKYAGHGDDLQYLFQSIWFLSNELNEQDLKMADIVQELWTNFAKTGSPTSKDLPTKHPELHWDIATSDNFRYLDLNLNSSMVNGRLTTGIWRKAYQEIIKKSIEIDDNRNNPIVKTPNGKVKGSILKSDKGADIFAFRGIPYAQPPVKKLRFEPPRPAIPWTDVLDATEDGYSCIQFDFFTYHLLGDEDCLYANVYTTKLPTGSETEKRAVMVFIHGGGFLSGSGKTSLYGPQRLMDKEVVVVNFNYRLGPLGFFSTGDEIAPGNYGLLDQVMALRWVRDNIDSFGGDPNRVTIFGQSAGSASVLMHILSPLSKGLFQGAIALSGSPSSSWSIENDPAENAKIVANQMKCPSESSADLVACLKTKSALDIVYQTSLKAFITSSEKLQKYVYRLKPVVDKLAGNWSFLPEHPSKLMLDGKLNAVPTIIGITSDEAAAFYGYLAFLKKSTPGILKAENLEKLMDMLISHPFGNAEQAIETAKKIRKEYFEQDSTTDKYHDIRGFIAVLSDAEMNYDIGLDVELLSKHGIGPFVYRFAYRGERSYTDFDMTGQKYVPKDLGAVSHLDDLQYLFHLDYFKHSELSAEDNKMADICTTLVTNFAKTKIPSLEGSTMSPKDFIWNHSTSEKPRYLDITLTPKMVDGILCEKQDLWTSIFKQTSKRDSRRQ